MVGIVACVVLAAGLYAVTTRGGSQQRHLLPLEPTTTRPDTSGVSIVGVGGTTTTTVPEMQGTVSFAGTVQTADGTPIPGASVRAEWFRVDPPQHLDVIADDQGHYEIKDVAGGRWRIRAWRVPDVATAKAADLFVDEGTQRTRDLEVRKVDPFSVTWDIEPDPPIIDHNAELVAEFTEQTVTVEGKTDTVPLRSLDVRLVTDSAWEQVRGDSTVATDIDGQATWVLRCLRAGTHAMRVSSTYGSETLAVAACIPISATTTTTTTPPGGSTTSSS